ncbi:threonine/serine ThrE exporter family protein [Agromyces laixinhei]|uniref:threonine/serine ThrE exporter family protein n=1 Tax=Agromyces laixinhei TaxID=2585717 RepID=UPI0018DDC836|nr:threonine/serine exporter family protein [Agromyces laixinhei]
MSGLADRIRAAASAFRDESPIEASAGGAMGVPEMLGEIGAALLDSSQATSDVEEILKRIADRYARPELRVFVLPTLVLVEDPTTTPSQTSIFPANESALRLDQSDAVERLVRHSVRDRATPESVISAITQIRRTDSRFGPVLTVVGYTLLTVGFGMVLNPTVSALPIYFVLGVVVGTIVQVGSRASTLSLILPAFTAFAVTLLISLLIGPFVHDDVIRLVAPSLVSFLPGLTLTVAAVELTSGQMMAGASRLVFGIARLGLLVFGVFVGVSVAGAPAPNGEAPVQLGAWAPWTGIALVALGYYFFSAAPRRSLVWILYALVVAYSAQLLGNLMLGPELSGLVGALLVIPAVNLAGRLKGAPSKGIMLTCAYWLLVPGAMGFIGLSNAASGTAGATGTILQTFGSLIAIAIGMVLGAGLRRDATAIARGWHSVAKDEEEPRDD